MFSAWIVVRQPRVQRREVDRRGPRRAGRRRPRRAHTKPRSRPGPEPEPRPSRAPNGWPPNSSSAVRTSRSGFASPRASFSSGRSPGRARRRRPGSVGGRELEDGEEELVVADDVGEVAAADDAAGRGDVGRRPRLGGLGQAQRAQRRAARAAGRPRRSADEPVHGVRSRSRPRGHGRRRGGSSVRGSRARRRGLRRLRVHGQRRSVQLRERVSERVAGSHATGPSPRPARDETPAEPADATISRAACSSARNRARGRQELEAQVERSIRDAGEARPPGAPASSRTHRGRGAAVKEGHSSPASASVRTWPSAPSVIASRGRPVGPCALPRIVTSDTATSVCVALSRLYPDSVRG